MNQSESKMVTDLHGVCGVIETRLMDLNDNDHPHLLVRLDNGERVLVPLEALDLQEDGHYHLPFSMTELERHYDEIAKSRDDALVVPVMTEELKVEKREVEGGRVRLIKQVHEREEIIDEPLLEEEVEVQHVPINRVVDGPLSIRYEGHTMIIPLLEEVLVVEKRLMLKEEVHITKRRAKRSKPQPVTLRTEEVIVERIENQTQQNFETQKRKEE